MGKGERGKGCAKSYRTREFGVIGNSRVHGMIQVHRAHDRKSIHGAWAFSLWEKIEAAGQRGDLEFGF